MTRRDGFGSLPPTPAMPQRTRAEVAALLAEGDRRTDAMLEKIDREKRYQAVRDANRTPADKARTAALDRVRKLRRTIRLADEAARFVEALRLLDAMPFVIDPAASRAEQLRANVEAGTARLRALAADGCAIAAAYLAKGS